MLQPPVDFRLFHTETTCYFLLPLEVAHSIAEKAGFVKPKSGNSSEMRNMEENGIRKAEQNPGEK
jgi:hypothetical protein